MTNFSKRSFRVLLGLGVCIPAFTASAFAQESSESGESQEIIVTGSRIPTIKDQGPSPVTVIGPTWRSVTSSVSTSSIGAETPASAAPTETGV